MEMLIVVVIAAVLAAIAFPQFQKTIERNYWQVAGNILMTIYAGERAYFLNNGFYYGPLLPTSGMAQWRIISMDDPNLVASIPILYGVITNPTKTAYTGISLRTGGPCDQKTRTIDQDRVDSGAGQACWSTCGC